MLALRRLGPAPHRPRVVLICLPYAGGGANVFARWPEGLPAGVEVRSPVLPGRESLLHAPPIRRLDEYVDALDQSITHTLGTRPYALFGHSLGALVAYELSCTRLLGGRPLPVALVVGGQQGPSACTRRRRIASLPPQDFLRALGRLQGTPRELLENGELMELLLPALRADFQMSEEYHPVERSRLPLPILTLTGSRDPDVTPGEAAAWAACTDADFRVKVLRGGHFFLHDQRAETLREITSALHSAGVLSGTDDVPTPAAPGPRR